MRSGAELVVVAARCYRRRYLGTLRQCSVTMLWRCSVTLKGAIRTPWQGSRSIVARGRPGHAVVKAKPYGRPAAGLDNGSVVRRREPLPNKRHRAIAR